MVAFCLQRKKWVIKWVCIKENHLETNIPR